MSVFLNRAKSAIRTSITRHRMPLITAVILNGIRWKVRLALGRVDSDLGSTHSKQSVDEAVAYIERVFDSYKSYAGVSHFCGRAVEVGPGDSAGVALLMRRDGCEHVDLVDRFRSRRDPQHQAAIYETLSRRHGLSEFRIAADWANDRLAGVDWHVGISAEAFFRNRAANSDAARYDFIVSRSVLEYFRDPLGCLRDMVKCLSPGGKLLHQIDLRDHRLFSPTQHELAWLEVPSRVYRWMTNYPKVVNRILTHRYRAVLEELEKAGLIDFRLFVTRVVGGESLDPYQSADSLDAGLSRRAREVIEGRRSRFAHEFRDVDAQDLAVTGILIVVERRG